MNSVGYVTTDTTVDPQSIIPSYTFSTEFTELVDTPRLELTNLTQNQRIIGSSPICDRIDKLKRFLIKSNSLMTKLELNNTARVPELTSVDYPTTWSISSNINSSPGNISLTTKPRQDVTLTPHVRRWIPMRGGPISNIQLEAQAEVYDIIKKELRHETIPLQPGSVFNVKLSFWVKKV